MDSAAGTAKEARDRKTQAILALKGKILNILKKDISAVLANEEIKSMIAAFGLIIKNNKIVVDEKKLRYGKIVMLVDSDVDGSHIRILLLTFLWIHARDLITQGRVYSAMPPLYKVVRGTTNTESVYLLNDRELEAYKQKYPNAHLAISRFKG